MELKGMIKLIIKTILAAILFISNMAIYGIGFPMYYRYISPMVNEYMLSIADNCNKFAYVMCKFGYIISAFFLIILCIVYTCMSIGVFYDSFDTGTKK